MQILISITAPRMASLRELINLKERGEVPQKPGVTPLFESLKAPLYEPIQESEMKSLKTLAVSLPCMHWWQDDPGVTKPVGHISQSCKPVD